MTFSNNKKITYVLLGDYQTPNIAKECVDISVIFESHYFGFVWVEWTIYQWGSKV
jgi:hypothetical protein